MKFSKLFKLQKAIRNLDLNYIVKKIDELEAHLNFRGQEFEPECTAITEEGIFYISPETGMATKVVLYLAEPPSELSKSALSTNLQEYHILRCNTLRHFQTKGWKGNYRIAQRMDGTFCCKIKETVKVKKQITEQVKEIDNQKLNICQNCFVKVNSLLEGVRNTERELFKLKYFFDVDFTRSWLRHAEHSKHKGSLEEIYPRDWTEISRIRKKQVQFHCESCDTDLSHPTLRRYLHVFHSDHCKRKVRYVKLECLCIACLADLPSHQSLKQNSEYIEFQANRSNLDLLVKKLAQ